MKCQEVALENIYYISYALFGPIKTCFCVLQMISSMQLFKSACNKRGCSSCAVILMPMSVTPSHLLQW